jgi:hypothetical protein
MTSSSQAPEPRPPGPSRRHPLHWLALPRLRVRILSWEPQSPGPRPVDRPRPPGPGPESSGPHRIASPPLPIPNRARTSAIGRLHRWPWSQARAGDAVRRSETFISSDLPLIPGHGLGADYSEAPSGWQRGSLPLDVLVECRGYLRPQREVRTRREHRFEHGTDRGPK